MSARAVLAPRVNSHPFQERSVSLDQPLKIGRSVARSRPGASNAIFDCKVLSRNHALMWYEAGKFYLQDTKSSNGTFVNNVRLSKSSEESPPTQITSGDVLQFGVDVMELTKKVTHGCIVATLQLFTPDGKEAKGPALSDKPPTTLQDIYALNQFIREAAEREEKLESKINEMSAILSQTNEALEAGWKALIEEDRLLTRVDILERQLQACHKSMTEDKLRVEVVELLSDKENYQEAAKEALRKSLAEKAEALKKQQELERTLRNGEDERQFLRETAEKAKEELDKLAAKHEVVEKNLASMQDAMETMSLAHKEDVEALNLKWKDDQDALKDKDEMITELLAKVQQNTSFTQPFQSVVSIHNHNEEDAGGENEKEGLNLDVTRVDKGDNYEINEELSELRKKLKQVEADKSNICARLVHIQEMFALVHVTVNSNPYSEGNLKTVVNKMEMELRQIKNTTAFQEPKSPSDHGEDYGTIIQPEPSHQTLISPDECDENQKHVAVKVVSQNEAFLQKLLDDARHSIVILEQKLLSQEAEFDHKINLIRALQRENVDLVAAQEKRDATILELQEQLETLEASRKQDSVLNSTLLQDNEADTKSPKSRNAGVEITNPSSLEQNPSLDSPQGNAKAHLAKDIVDQATAPKPATISYELIGKETRIPDMEKSNDLNSREIVTGTESSKQSVLNGSVSSKPHAVQESINSHGIRERFVPEKQLLDVDEELGIFKERNARMMQENECLKLELAQIQNLQDSQNKRVLMLVPFILVLFLAVLIVFNPLN